MKNAKHEQTLGQFQDFPEEQYLTYSAGQTSPDIPRTNKKTITPKKQTAKIKIDHHKNQNKNVDIVNFSNKPRTNTPLNSKVISIGDAIFRSNFQSGNLDFVHKSAPAIYQIVLSKQTNAERISSWFYFAVEGLKGEVKFIIKGFSKSKSLYNEGMKICFKQSIQGKWRRGGNKIVYTQSYIQNQEERQTFQLHFCYFFKSSYPNSVQFAYSFPYTYTKLLKFLTLNRQKLVSKILCKTYEKRQIPFLQIGNKFSMQVIIISARVHPGQSVSSYLMEGFLKELISDNEISIYLRETFLFIIVPMINPDGVVNGNYRFSGAGFDLNRKWKTCTVQMHPEVFYFRQKIKQISKEKQILMFIDLHGHSRQKNIFFYGCIPKGCEVLGTDSSTKPKLFPYLMSKLHHAYRYDLCSYGMSKDKEGTARIVIWNQLKIHYVYTLETSFCGMQNLSNFQIEDYQRIGSKLCLGICYHFWEFVQKNCAKSVDNTKVQQQASKNVKQFYQNPDLANIQFKGNSSDSQPQVGQIPENQRNQRKKDKATNSISKSQKFSRVSKRAKNEETLLKERQLDSRSRPRTKLSESMKIALQKQSTIQPVPSESLGPKTQTNFCLKTDFMNRTLSNQVTPKTHLRINDQISRSGRLNSELFTKNEIVFYQSQNIDQNDNRNKKKSLSFEGAQYRRIRKFAQESNRGFDSQAFESLKTEEFLLKGLQQIKAIGKEETKKQKPRAASFFGGKVSYHNYRKGSMDTHFKRQIKLPDYKSKRLHVNGLGKQVQCLGKQIL